MKYAYYPGCAAESTGRDQHESTLAVARALGIELIEPAGWTCCGSTPAHQQNRGLALSLAAANLVKVREMGLDMAVSCASCFNRMKTANHEISASPETRALVAGAIGKDYDGSVRVRHFIEIIVNDLGLEEFGKSCVRSLNGLKIASYYGCLLVRPNEITGFDDPENPVFMDLLVQAMGGEAVEWPHKTECCGASLTLTRPELAVDLSASIFGMARDSGAECIAVACPLCQMNLDMRQDEIAGKTGSLRLPVMYITQLMGLCLGLREREIGMQRLMNPADEIAARVMNHG